MDFLSVKAPDVPSWKILLVDDEPDVHVITKLTLGRFQLDGRPLKFLNAYSGAEAKTILSKETDIALVFLDVVMETEESGLEVARWMREELKNKFTRIVLRTGQPGQAPEERVIIDYDINDYKEKTELDRKKLITTTYAALRAYRDIMEVDAARHFQSMYREGLERVIDASGDIFRKRYINDFACGLLQQVVALLRLEKSMLLRLRGATAITGQKSYEILARIGDFDENLGIFTENFFEELEVAGTRAISRLNGDTYIAYFPSQSGKSSLLVLQGLEEISEMDLKLLEVFANNVAIAFDNVLINHDAAVALLA